MTQTSQIIIVSTLSSSPPLSLPNSPSGSPHSPTSLNGCEDRQHLRAALESALSLRAETDQHPIFIHNPLPADLPLIGHTLASLDARIAWTSIIPVDYPPNMSEEVAALAEFSTHILALGDPPSPRLRHFVTSLNPFASLLPTPSLSAAFSPDSPSSHPPAPNFPSPCLDAALAGLTPSKTPPHPSPHPGSSTAHGVPCTPNAGSPLPPNSTPKFCVRAASYGSPPAWTAPRPSSSLAPAAPSPRRPLVGQPRSLPMAP